MSFQRKNKVVVNGRRRPIQQISIESPSAFANPDTESQNEAVNVSNLIRNTRFPPGRIPGSLPVNREGLGLIPGRLAAQGTGVNRGIVNSNRVNIDTKQPTLKPIRNLNNLRTTRITDNISIFPSMITSDTSCVSTGCLDLDKLLGHGGIPLLTGLLIKEQQCTDYSSVLMKYFITQGIIHDRIYKKKYRSNDRKGQNGGCHVIVVGPPGILTDLPGLYLGSKKEVKKRLVKENEKKFSVSNLVDQEANNNNQTNKSMKIAWRYGLNDNKDHNKNSENVLENNKRPDYNHLFDLGAKLDPPANSTEISYVNIFNNQGLMKVLDEIEKIVESRNENVVIRIALPNLLNPGMYPANAFLNNKILPFLISLKALLNKKKNLCMLSSLQTSLFCGDHDSVLTIIENLFGSIIELDPFSEDLLKFLERSYKKDPNKIQQGFVNVWKIYYLSDFGNMVIKKNEFAFRNGKRHFEISEWSIPVDEEEPEKEQQHTTKNIEF